MPTIDDIKETLQIISDTAQSFFGKIKDNPGTCCICLFAVLTFVLPIYLSLLTASVLYSFILLRCLLTHRIDMDHINAIDINYFNLTKDNRIDPLDAYIDFCFNTYILIFRGYKRNQYIRDKEEKLILKELMDMVASNMSESFRSKLELYYGRGHVEAILAQKCFIRVSIYAADANKAIYSEENKDSADKLTKEMMQQMMKQ